MIRQFFLGGVMSFFIGTIISLFLVLDRPLRGEYGITPEAFRVLLGFINIMLGKPVG